MKGVAAMRFAGPVEDFYVVPDPLPPGDPGEVIRVQEVAADEASTTWRIMYHSRDARQRDRAVTGTVTWPNGPAPPRGWPVLSWAHGTCGLGPMCAPSRSPEPYPAFGIDGVVAVTDYVGLGPVGEIHPYLSKPSEGNAVIDAVRAARHLIPAAGHRWFSIGHSQGGHGALAAAELAAGYAPELDLRATVAFAPASDLDRTFDGIDAFVSRVVTAMALYGAAAEHPEIDPDDYVGPELAAVADVIRTQWLDAIVPAVALLPFATFWRKDPLQTEPARSLLLANEVGVVAVDAPLLLVAGTDDDRAVLDRVRSLHARLGAVGQDTEFIVLDGVGHHDLVDQATPQVTAWLTTKVEALCEADLV